MAAVALIAAAWGGLSASPARAQNLLSNGSFELPAYSSPGGFFPASIPGWSLSNSIEIQKGIYTAQDGSQYAELDDIANTSISQTLTIIPGYQAELKFYYSPRPGQPASTLGLDVKLDGNTIFALAADGSSLSDTNWTLYSYAYTPTTSSATIVFTGTGTSDARGAFLDNVTYTQVPAPLPVIGPVAALTSFRRLRRLRYRLRQGQA
ncbi:MAG: DUF642 domain-containing protein [Cyanobacteriota bacterium]